MMRITASKVKTYWKEYGTLALAKKVVLRIRSFLFWYKQLDFYGISGLPQTDVQPRCPLEIRRGSEQDIDLMVQMLNYLDEATARKRERYLFDNGGKVFLGFNEGNLVHIAWLFCLPGIREADHSVKIKQDEVYISSCDTHSEYQGKNIYPAVLQHIVKHAFTQNKRRCFISTSPRNLASIRGIEKAGFSFVGKMRMFKLFGKSFNNQWVSSDTVKPD